jgi:hypothetical protein
MNTLKLAGDVPQIGIWWLVKGGVISYKVPYNSLPVERLMCVDKEHRHTWDTLRSPYLEKIPELGGVEFDEVERGRVWYNTRYNRFIVACSEDISNNSQSIALIKYHFNLENIEFAVHSETQYDRTEIKVEAL